MKNGKQSPPSAHGTPSRRLALRLALFAFLFSVLWTLVASGAYLYAEYFLGRKTLDGQVSELQETYLPAVSESLWVLNFTLIQAQLDGIARMPYISYTSVHIANGHVLDAGIAEHDPDWCRSTPVNYDYGGSEVFLGDLELCTDPGYLREGLLNAGIRILILQAVSISTITLAVFFLFYSMVGRHLENLARQARTTTSDTLATPIRMNRPPGNGNGDELDVLQGAMNEMRSTLGNALSERRAREEQFRTLFETMRQGVVYHSSSGEVIDANPAALSILGITMEEILGKTSDDSRWQSLREDGNPFPGEEHPAMVALQTGKEISNVTMAVYNPRIAEYRWILINATPLCRKGEDRPYQVHVTFDDITDRRRMQDMMIQSEKMVSLGGLSAGMAHEINNPLAAIAGHVQNIRNRTLKNMAPNKDAARECGIPLDALQNYLRVREVPMMLDSTMEAVNRAANIVRNMLGFSRASESRFSSHDLRELVDTTLELVASDYDLNRHYDFKHIEIVKEYEDAPLDIICEANEIRQVFFNIFKNSAQAMSEKRYQSGAPRFVIRTRRRQESAELSIEDNGPGMQESIRKRIFEPFFTTKNPGHGTGLGLSVSYFIITELHKGSMEVQSLPDQYTRFIIRLPLH